MVRVPGAWELPLAARAWPERSALCRARRAGLRGARRHPPLRARRRRMRRAGLMQVSLDTGVPVANGVLAVEQLRRRRRACRRQHGNKGEEAALVAIEMANLS